jgi:hypothetical protein
MAWTQRWLPGKRSGSIVVVALPHGAQPGADAVVAAEAAQRLGQWWPSRTGLRMAWTQRWLIDQR